jgi:hypothetical protein
MKGLIFFGVAMALAVAVSAPPVSAGVVMKETSVASGPEGGTIQNSVVYVQGNKQKIEKPGVDAITDLDRGVVYVVDKNHRKYIVLPLKRTGPYSLEEVHLDPTEQTHIVANLRCTEYRGGENTGVEKVAVAACISKDAPGAREVSTFERNAVSRIEGVLPKDFRREEGRGGIVLAKISAVSFRVPDPQSNAYRTASFMSRTEVTSVEVKSLPQTTFEPPKNFVQLETVPGSAGPGPSQPDNSDGNNYQVRNDLTSPGRAVTLSHGSHEQVTLKRSPWV